MMRRQDNNGVLLLEIVTRCILDMNEVILCLLCFFIHTTNIIFID
ncbi:unnamed protein product [Schistosoma curassoni]|uniref:ZSWIM8 TPR repeats domain-containing protein n=1 Tax=Schistosoma curassoni TaxID=6186 RepID=A0A183JS07_9TREM|nr:unnamed protein product [Schistosoma curassoni]